MALVGGLVGLALVVGYLAWNWRHQQGKAIATAQSWAIEGAACPTATAAEFEAQIYRAKRAFD